MRHLHWCSHRVHAGHVTQTPTLSSRCDFANVVHLVLDDSQYSIQTSASPDALY